MSFSADVATWLANINTDVTTKTAPSSITPANVGGDYATLKGFAGAGNLLEQLEALISASGDLDAVLTLGNESDLTVNIKNAGLEFKTEHAYNGIATIHDPSSSPTDYPVTFIGRLSGYNVLYLRDAFGYFGYMGAGALTADRKVLLPDEGNGVGLGATLVTHTTKDAITVTSGTDIATYGKNIATIDDGSGNVSSFTPTYHDVVSTAGTTLDVFTMYKNKLEYVFTNSIGSISYVKTLHTTATTPSGSATYDQYLPEGNGVLALLSDVTAANNFTYALATDANYTVPSTHIFIELPATTAPRNIVMPTATAGAQITIANLSSNVGDWTFTGTVVKDASGATLSTLNVTTTFTLIGNGTIWRRIN